VLSNSPFNSNQTIKAFYCEESNLTCITSIVTKRCPISSLTLTDDYAQYKVLKKDII